MLEFRENDIRSDEAWYLIRQTNGVTSFVGEEATRLKGRPDRAEEARLLENARGVLADVDGHGRIDTADQPVVVGMTV